jgi:beta-N-acetylhexosaminidase
MAAVRSGRLPGTRLEEAAARVAELRAWTLAAGAAGAAGTDRAGSTGASAIGLAAARRAITVSGSLPLPGRPLAVQLVPPSNLAAGAVPWGLSAFVPADSYREISTGTQPADLADQISGVLAAAAGRTLIIVVRDAHRYPAAVAAVEEMLAVRPDAVVLEMGLPVWRPAGGSYVTSYGAARSNSRAAAEILGLAAP